MILYNVTIAIDQTLEIQWLNWMQEKHIKEVLATGCFVSARLCRLDSHAQPDSTSYAVQYLCESHELLKKYKQDFAPALKKEGVELFGERAQIFRTELTVINDYYPNQS